MKDMFPPIGETLSNMKTMLYSGLDPKLSEFVTDSTDLCLDRLKMSAIEKEAEMIIGIRVSQTTHKGATMVVTMLGTAVRGAP